MTRRRLAFGLVLALGIPGPLTPQPADAELQRGVRQVEDGEFDAAVLTLDGVARRAKEKGGSAADLARAQLYLGVAYAGLGHEATAKARFIQALEIDRNLALSSRQFPPRVLQLFEEARLEVATPPARAGGAPAPGAPGSVAQAQKPKKEGGSKGLLIGAGVAVAAGVGIAVGTGGGSSSSGSSTPPSSQRGTPRAVISNVTPTGVALARVTRVFFSGRQSSDPEGQSLTYSWDFGDGSNPQTAGDVSHAFPVCMCTVRLTVTDPTGLQNTTSVVVTSRKLDGSWDGHYSSSAPSFSVVLSQGTTNFGGRTSDGFDIRGTLSDPRNVRFLIENVDGPPGCQEVRSFEGRVTDTLDRIDANGEGCQGQTVALGMHR